MNTFTLNSIPSYAWTLTDDFLVEELSNGGHRIWGRWDRQFGCWDKEGNPISPTGTLLGHLGKWFEPTGDRDDKWYQSRAAIAAYWSIIPTPVRLVVSQQVEQQWLVLQRAWLNYMNQ
jgi:hypothetical protein